MARFPLNVKVLPWNTDMRQFGWRRPSKIQKSGLRAHAACDLYAPIGTPIYAIADGFFQLQKNFYLGTDQLVIHHPGIGVVRYGELMKAEHYKRDQSHLRKEFAASREEVPRTGITCPSWKDGGDIKEGEVIGAVGDLTGTTLAMLHFELYLERAKGDELSTTTGIYERHDALQDPTEVLAALEKGQIIPGRAPANVILPAGSTGGKRGKGKRAALDPMDWQAPDADQALFVRRKNDRV
jgi:murein DD-endopeptidase MepM/ murein hydrolase activator NlpD